MQLNERQIDRAARAYRNSIFGTQIEDKAWEACKVNWIKDFTAFMANLEATGLKIVEK